MGRGRVLATTIVLASAIAASVSWGDRSDWGSAPATPLVLGLVIASVWLMFVATAMVLRWRPTSRLGWMIAVLSASWSWFVVTVMTPIEGGGLFSPAVLIRPSLFLLLLAWPSGYLARADRTWWTVYAVLQAVLLWAVPQLFESADGRRLVIADLEPLVSIAHAFGLAVVLPVGAVVLFVSVRRRAVMLPESGRRMMQPIVLAAAVMMAAELVFSVWVAFDEPGFGDDGPELLGGLFLLTNYLPYAITPVLVIVAVGRARVAAQAPTSIEIGPLHDALRRLTAASRAPGLDVRFAGPSGEWLDIEGRSVTSPRTTTVVEIRRDDQLLATVATNDELSPDEIERAVASAGASVDFARLAATEKANQRSAEAARGAFVAARDDAMTRLERDLHDGVQQRLVGLALQASLAARTAIADDHVAQDLRIGIRAAQDDLADAASGVLRSLVGARGLSASIGTLAACVALHVDVDIDLPADIPPDVSAAAWFVAAESVANASKHAAASRLTLRGGLDRGVDGTAHLVIAIDDDGCGGADARGSGLLGLRARVERLGGELDVVSPVGRGTAVRARLPLPIAGGVDR